MMYKVLGTLSKVLSSKSKTIHLSFNNFQKCTCGLLTSWGWTETRFKTAFICYNNVDARKNEYYSFIKTRKPPHSLLTIYQCFTFLQIKRFYSELSFSLMSRKKRKLECDELKDKSHKKKKSKKSLRHEKESRDGKDNDSKLICKKSFKKSKKKKKQREYSTKKRHFSDHTSEPARTKKRKMSSDKSDAILYVNSNSEIDTYESHDSLEEDFSSCCKVGRDRSELKSRSSREIEESNDGSTSFFNKLQDFPPGGTKEAHLTFRERIDEIRKFECTPAGQDSVWEPWNPKEVKFEFRVLSYNVLSQELLESNPHLYRRHNPAHLEWSHRAPLLMNELRNSDADIICLQEVEAGHKPFFDELEQHGYKGIFKKRTGDKNDGCAIYYRTAKFTLADHTTVEYRQPEATLLDRDNVGIVAKLHPVGWERYSLVVATTHLLYNPNRHDVKLAQMQVLLAEIERLAHNSQSSNFKYHPIILTGDFNLERYTSVYQMINTGVLHYADLDRKTLKLDGPSPPLGRKLLPSSLGITDSCQHLAILKKRNNESSGTDEVEGNLIGLRNSEREFEPSPIQVSDEDKYRFGSGVLTHGFNFQSVYNNKALDRRESEPVATTYHDRWLTVDFMLYTPLECSKYLHHQLQLVNRSRLPTVSECQRYIKLLPNKLCPSDHLPLVATFYLRVRPKAEPQPVSSRERRGRKSKR